ncbi:MAG: ABC transporter permease [Halobacteriaceae archaeon]
MNLFRRFLAETRTATYSFLRRRTAVFFTFLFPLLIIVIFGVLVQTDSAGGLLARPAGYYVPGYLAVVILFTPLSRIGSTVARYRDGNRFEKLATTPLRKSEWLAAQTFVNTLIILIASILLLGALLLLTNANIIFTPLLLIFIASGVILFCGIGAILGFLADSQDGVIAASNAIALPLLFLSDTFIPPSMLPSWFRPVILISPLTYFSRGIRALTYYNEPAIGDMLILIGLAVVFFVLGSISIPVTD